MCSLPASAPALLQVPIDDVGTSIGLTHAIRALCGIISPVAGGYMVVSWGYATALGLVPAALALVALLVLCTIGPISPVVVVE